MSKEDQQRSELAKESFSAARTRKAKKKKGKANHGGGRGGLM